jgi:hypothetical protein
LWKIFDEILIVTMNKYLKNADIICWKFSTNKDLENIFLSLQLKSRVHGKFSYTAVFELILRKNKILYKGKLLQIFRLSYLSEEILAWFDGWIQKISYQLFLT